MKYFIKKLLIFLIICYYICMKNSSQFDLLTKHLDEEERKQLLHKIKKDKNNNLIIEEEFSDNLSQNKNTSVYEKQIRIAKNVYDNESLLVKIIIWIVSLFTGKKKEDVVLNKLFKDLKKDILLINDGIINFESDVLTNFFTNEINNLYDACNLVLPVIDKFFNDTIFYNSFLSFIFEKNFDDNLKKQLDELNPENFNIDSSKIDKELYLDEKKKRINNFFKQLSLFPISDLNKKFINFEIFIRFITFDFRTLIYYFIQDNNIDASQIKYGVKFSVVESLLEKLFIILNSINFNYNDIDKLDSLSFFYLLGLISNQSPAKFFKERLKGEANEAKFIQVLDDTLKESDKNLTHQDFRWLTFKLSWKFPEVLESVLLPDIIQKIKKEMEAGWLPISPNVIAFSGDDIIKRIGDKNGPLVGKIQEQMFKDALNDLYLWKERKDTLEHLDYLISKFI